MIRITIGEVYTAYRARSGSSANGDWELLVVKDDKSKDEMTLWLSNPGTGLVDGGQFVIKSIDIVTKKRVPYKDGKVCRDRSQRDVTWRLDVDMNVTVEPVSFATTLGLDVSAADFDDGDLPFDMSDNPFESAYEQLPL